MGVHKGAPAPTPTEAEMLTPPAAAARAGVSRAWAHEVVRRAWRAGDPHVQWITGVAYLAPAAWWATALRRRQRGEG